MPLKSTVYAITVQYSTVQSPQTVMHLTGRVMGLVMMITLDSLASCSV